MEQGCEADPNPNPNPNHTTRLVGQGCDADLPTHDGTTPLHWAVWQGQLAVCQYLVGGMEIGLGLGLGLGLDPSPSPSPSPNPNQVGGGLADVHACNSYGCNAVQWGAQSVTFLSI